MAVTVDLVLVQRRRAAARSNRIGVWMSILLHGGFVVALLAVPRLTPSPTQPMRFVSVALVSAQALGIRDPAPAAQAPARQSAPAPRPERPVEPPRSLATPSQPAPVTQPTPRPELRRRQGSPTGSTTGTASLGAKVGFDNPNFRHSYFVDRMTAMLAAQWQRPALGGELLVLVHFKIHQSGSVSDLQIVQSSGYSSYDLAALRAVHQAAPFPPLPQSYTKRSLGVTVEFI